jgi:hypothetical protein
MIVIAKYSLQSGKGFRKRLDVCGDILIDAAKSRAVVPKVWSRREVEIVCVARETRTETERKLGLQMTYLINTMISLNYNLEFI